MRDFIAFEGHARGAREIHFTKSAAKKKDLAEAMAKYRQRGQLNPSAVRYEQPVYFKCNRMSVIGHNEEIIYPSLTRELDYELELAFITGQKGKDISQADGHNFIFGYTILNDISTRDAQIPEMRC